MAGQGGMALGAHMCVGCVDTLSLLLWGSRIWLDRAGWLFAFGCVHMVCVDECGRLCHCALWVDNRNRARPGATAIRGAHMVCVVLTLLSLLLCGREYGEMVCVVLTLLSLLLCGREYGEMAICSDDSQRSQ